jgi:hypothetical protein
LKSFFSPFLFSYVSLEIEERSNSFYKTNSIAQNECHKAQHARARGPTGGEEPIAGNFIIIIIYIATHTMPEVLGGSSTSSYAIKHSYDTDAHRDIDIGYMY